MKTISDRVVFTIRENGRAGFRLPLTLAEGRALLQRRDSLRLSPALAENDDPNTGSTACLENKVDSVSCLDEGTLRKRIETLNALIEAVEYSRAVFVRYDYDTEARAGGAVDQRRVKQQVVREAVALGLRRSVVQALQACSEEAITNSWLVQVVCEGWQRPPSPPPPPLARQSVPQYRESRRSWRPGTMLQNRAERQQHVSTRPASCCRCM
ncbi:hypothetical protein F1559_005128 [Cyanidiococcus yangmingshanensis]|uniref:Uncharacterized protein n=1 Tax=Cyanidiococcus yangmingshanensis TaxID=2690220 RepID=A0A7J7ISI5_9RHOD|nr:hypothetical protein F1559_005128 [Cyanidiococcus yangmingshanensis]